MFFWKVICILGVISLGSTLISLGLQSYFGHAGFFALIGVLLATISAGTYALWLRKRQ